nr:alanine racemase [uncultured Cetobacterium sp.]
MSEFKVLINKKNLVYNYNYLKSTTQKEIIAVVKANAYGHGLEETVKILLEEGCKYFAVTREYEAEKILKTNLKNFKILMMDKVENINFIKNNSEIEIFINSLEELKEKLNEGISPKKMHLKLDFGFGRNGILIEEIEELKNFILKKNLYFKGIATHLFDATYKDMKKIESDFFKIIKDIGRERFQIIHTQNSAGVISIKGEGCTHIRCGTILFGLQEIGYYDENVKRVFKLVGKISEIKDTENLKYIGYRLKDELNLKKNSKIAKINIGYGDGFSKRSENLMSIINNKKFRIVHIAMDNSFIEVDDSVNIGDEVEIFYDLEESMKYLKVPHYEFLSAINERIKRQII